MKRITLLVLLFSFSFVFAVMSEDLGELAKKEKQRREALDKSGKKAKVFTNEDVDNLKSDIAVQSTPPEGETADTATEDSSYTPPVEGAEYVPDPEPQKEASDPNVDRQREIRELEEQREELERTIQEAQETVGSGGLYHTRNTGDQYKTAREAEDKLDKIDRELEEKKSKQREPQQAETPRSEEPVYEYEPPPSGEAQETPAAEEPPVPEEEPPF